MTQPLDRSARIPQVGQLDSATGEFWRENVFEMGAGTDNLSAYEANRMYLNLDGQRFLDCSFGSGCDIDSDSRSVAAADFDRDGAPDLLIGSVGGGPLRLFANRFSDKHHAVRIDLNGTKSNRLGIGSRAIATVGERRVVRDLFPANGCLGQAPSELLMGVGAAEKIDQLEIRWPDGRKQLFADLPVDGVLTITEGQSDFQFVSFDRLKSNEPASRPRPDISTYVSIDKAKMLAADSSDLASHESVLGIELDGDVRAYPLRYLRTHHLCHDIVDGHPLLISYCPQSASGTAFERQLEGEDRKLTLDFDVAGMIRSTGYTVLRDRQTKSLWNPLTGQCVQGPLRGTRLKRVPCFLTDWAHWRSLDSETRILAPELASYPADRTDNSDSGSKYVSNVRDSCDPDALGLGILGQSQQLFLPLEDLSARGLPLIAGRLDDRRIVVLYDQQRSVAQCFYAATTSGINDITFSVEQSRAGHFVARDGSIFDIMGRCKSGPLVGSRLEPVVDTTLSRWYAWSATFPKTFVVQTKN